MPAGTPLRVTLALPQLSLAVALPNAASLTTVPHPVALGPVETLTAGGAVIVGGLLSVTVTVAEQELDAPLLSVTVIVTVVVPSGYGPGGDCVMVNVSPSGSEEPLLIEALAVQLGPAETVTF